MSADRERTDPVADDVPPEEPLPAAAVWLVRFLTLIVCILMFAMMALVFTDVTARYGFSAPITGAFEFIEFMLALLIFSGLPLVTIARGHITIGIFDDVLRGGVKWTQQFIIALCSAGALLFIAERLFFQAEDMRIADKITGVLETPVAPIVYVLAALGFLSFLLQLFLVWQLVRRFPQPWPAPKADTVMEDGETYEPEAGLEKR